MIRAAVIGGIATATEVSTVGVVYTALLGLLVYRQFDLRRIYPILVDTLSLTGAVMMIIGTATAMAWALDVVRLFAMARFSVWQQCRRHPGFLAITIVAFIILGSVLEGLPAIVYSAPAVPGGQGDGRPRGALCDDCHPGNGHRPVRAALRGRVLTAPARSAGFRPTTRCGGSGLISARWS